MKRCLLKDKAPFLAEPTLARNILVVGGYCHTRYRGGLKIFLDYGKRTDFWHLVLLDEIVLFKESPLSIMVTRNPNRSTEILWYEIGYVKGKILSPLKRSA
jgi:hypothetical protein